MTFPGLHVLHINRIQEYTGRPLITTFSLGLHIIIRSKHPRSLQNITQNIYFFFCYWQCHEDLYLDIIFVKLLTKRSLEEKQKVMCYNRHSLRFDLSLEALAWECRQISGCIFQWRKTTTNLIFFTLKVEHLSPNILC